MKKISALFLALWILGASVRFCVSQRDGKDARIARLRPRPSAKKSHYQVTSGVFVIRRMAIEISCVGELVCD